MHGNAESHGAGAHAGGGASDEPSVPPDLRRAIAAAVAGTSRQDLLVDYARSLGPDPELTGLDDAAVERQVRTGAAEIAAATCRWLGFVAELVVRGQWADQGAKTPGAWLSVAVGMGASTARDHVRVALRLRELPRIRERFATGTISYSKVRAITRVATPDIEEMLLEWSDAAPAHVLERIIADARRQQQVVADDDVQVESMTVTRRWRADGTYELLLRTDAATGLQVDAHLDRLVELDQPDEDDDSEAAAPVDAEDGDGRDEAEPVVAAAIDDCCGGPVVLPQPSRAAREAELLLGALASAVRAAPDDASGADRHLVVLHTTPAELLGASDATAPSASAEAAASRPSGVMVRDGRGRPRAMSVRQLWRWACTAGLDLAVDDGGGHPADLGRARRLPDARLRRLLQVRDRTCRFPSCGAVQFLHAHHVVHWKDGGPTDLSNLVLLCGFHHRLVHGDGWRLEGAGPGRWTFHRDDQEQRWARPLPGASAEAVLAAVRAHANDMDPDVAAKLLQPQHWDGDYDHAMTIEILCDRLAAAA